MSDGIGLRKLNPIAYVKTWRRKDWLAVALLLVVIAVFAIPTYLPKNGCEVARAAYKCIPAKDVIIENCNLWGNWSCNTAADSSLEQVEWYIGNLCKLHDQLHPDDSLNCDNLKIACNQATGQQVCGLA